jgi:hypothetical protein
VACHVTLRLGVIHATEELYHISIAQSVTPIGGRRNVKVKRLCNLEIARRVFWGTSSSVVGMALA